MNANRTDEDIARIVAVTMLLAKPSERDDVLRTGIPFDRYHRVLPLIAGVMADVVDQITARKKGMRLQVEGVLRTFLRQSKQ